MSYNKFEEDIAMSNNRKYDKVFYENYARLSLKYIYSDVHDFICKDKPDLQNLEKGIGIEVVRAITEDEGNYLSFINEIANKNLTVEQKEIRMAKRLHKQKENISCEFFNGGSSPSKGLVTPSAYLENVLKWNKEKNTKISDYKLGGWKQLGLYIFTFQDNTEQEIRTIIPKLCTESEFDFYIINAIDELYYIKKNQDYFKYLVSYDDMKFFKSEAFTLQAELLNKQ